MGTVTPAPIVLFAYRRPEHTRRALEALAANPEAAASELVAYADGARNEAAAPAVEATREALRAARGFASVRVVERERNWGLAANVSSGLTEVLGERGRAIVIEDDLLVSPAFLAYMNAALELYADEERAASIHGYVYPTGRPLPETFFLRGADCWGWATWERAWRRYDADAGRLARRLRSCPWKREFDFEGAYPYRRMLRESATGRVDSWAVRWYASAFVEGMYTLYPGRSLVANIGNDGTGTHGEATGRYDVTVAREAPRLERLSPATDPAGFRAFKEYFLGLRPSLGARIARRLRDIMGHRKDPRNAIPRRS